jgi:regulator of replication initiation timing
MKYRTKDEEVDALENEIESLKTELADAKKLASDLICENQGLRHKIDMMTKDADK